MPARRRTGRAALAFVAVAAAAVTSIVALDQPASASPTGPDTYTSGDARFEVLSPTLIRTEYAGDGRFTDAATFNAIGRDDFAPYAFTSRRARLADHRHRPVTLRYKVGSGPFTADNLTVTAQGRQAGRHRRALGGQPRPSCAVGALCEAEDAAAQRPRRGHRPHRIHRHRLRGRLPGRPATR